MNWQVRKPSFYNDTGDPNYEHCDVLGTFPSLAEATEAALAAVLKHRAAAVYIAGDGDSYSFFTGWRKRDGIIVDEESNEPIIWTSDYDRDAERYAKGAKLNLGALPPNTAALVELDGPEYWIRTKDASHDVLEYVAQPIPAHWLISRKPGDHPGGDWHWIEPDARVYGLLTEGGESGPLNRFGNPHN